MNDDYPISASQIKTFQKCPLQYKLHYIDRKPRSKAGSKYLDLGSRVHEAIEETLLDESIDITNTAELRTALLQRYRQKEEEYPIPDKEEQQGEQCCKTAVKYIEKREPSIRTIEKEMEFKIDNPDIDSNVKGIMDVATETEVWDWKTGTIRDDTSHGERIQGSIYMAAFFNAFGQAPEAIRFIYLKEGEVRSLEPNDENWSYMISQAKPLMNAKKTGEFPANVGDHCYWCDHEFHCHESPAGMANVPWEDY